MNSNMIKYCIQRKKIEHSLNFNLINKNNKILKNTEFTVPNLTQFFIEGTNVNFFITPGNYKFISTTSKNRLLLEDYNNGCIIITEDDKLEININTKELKKTIFNSYNNKIVTWSYNYSFGEINEHLTKYFKTDKIINLECIYKIHEENWNDILSILLNNCIQSNNYKTPVIKLKSDEEKDITHIFNQYYFLIISNSYKTIEINTLLKDEKLIILISDKYEEIDFTINDFISKIDNYINNFLLEEGKFYNFFSNIDNKLEFLKFLIINKISSYYLKIGEEHEIKFLNTIQLIINDNIIYKNINLKYLLIEYNFCI